MQKKYLKALTVAGATYLGIKAGQHSLDQIKKTAKSLKVSLDGVHDFKIQDKGLAFDVDLKIANPTDTSLKFDSKKLLELDKLSFFTEKGEFLGDAKPEISAIDLPENTETPISGISVFIPIKGPVSFIKNVVNALKKPKQIEIKADVKVLRKTFTKDLKKKKNKPTL